MKRILIVDDEQNFLLSLRDGLASRNAGFGIVLAGNGREAAEILHREAIDLLVTDLKLPIMDGFKLLAWVSRFRPRIPVIVMTAFGTPEIEARLTNRLNSLVFLEKPLDFELLAGAIDQALATENRSYIRGLTLATFLQLIAMEKKTCSLKVTTGSRTGYLFLRQGRLIDAECEARSGEEAALDIVAWNDTEIEMDGICRARQERITRKLEHLLMEAHRLRDEGQGPQSPQSLEAAAPPAAPALPTAEIWLEEFRDLLRSTTGVLEAVVFDQRNFIEFEYPDGCALARLELAPQFQQVEGLGRQLGKGQLEYFLINSDSLIRYLFSRLGDRRIAAALKPGFKPRDLLASIARLPAS